MVLLLMTALSLTAAQPEQVDWAMSPKVLGHQRVQVQLANGAKVEGRWLAIDADKFTIQVEKTSDRSLVPKKTNTLERSSIRVISRRHPHVRGRVIGTIAGFFAGAGIAAAATRTPDGLQGPAFFALVGSVAGGYFVGRSYDHAWYPIELIN